ncbi:MAG: glycerol-3-phosphate 1-O-acyltransferase PlsY [Rhodospirillales bacterium]|jgi:glycerol-3-phosphate acyltransferase PlsY|nr:glycerol-3-phosphate 1-O-acyltransferase PlsY [Rhodospirillales bacterium]
MIEGLGWNLAVAALAGYLVGSIPFGLVFAFCAGYGDIRNLGSGNIGATNVLRTGNKALAAATLLLDGCKGAAAVLIFARFGPGPETALVSGFAAVLGHDFPVWLRFKGGKGVATSLGVLLAASWPVGLAACGVWFTAATLTRYSSLGALFALAAAPFLAHWLAGPPLTALAVPLALLGIARHHANIRRLLKGDEPKMGRKRENTGGD